MQCVTRASQSLHVGMTAAHCQAVQSYHICRVRFGIDGMNLFDEALIVRVVNQVSPVCHALELSEMLVEKVLIRFPLLDDAVESILAIVDVRKPFLVIVAGWPRMGRRLRQLDDSNASLVGDLLQGLFGCHDCCCSCSCGCSLCFSCEQGLRNQMRYGSRYRKCSYSRLSINAASKWNKDGILHRSTMLPPDIPNRILQSGDIDTERMLAREFKVPNQSRASMQCPAETMLRVHRHCSIDTRRTLEAAWGVGFVRHPLEASYVRLVHSALRKIPLPSAIPRASGPVAKLTLPVSAQKSIVFMYICEQFNVSILRVLQAMMPDQPTLAADHYYLCRQGNFWYFGGTLYPMNLTAGG